MLRRKSLDVNGKTANCDNCDMLESEQRALYPITCVDFYRFLEGWCPGHWKLHRYSERLAPEVLDSL